MKFSRVIAAVIFAGLIVTGVASMAKNNEEPVEIWLIVDGTAIGTVKPGTFRYSWVDDYKIEVETNQLVYGCSHARIFQDRYEKRP